MEPSLRDQQCVKGAKPIKLHALAAAMALLSAPPNWGWRWLHTTDGRAMSLIRARRATGLGVQTCITSLQTLLLAGLEEQIPTLGLLCWFWRFCWNWPNRCWRFGHLATDIRTISLICARSATRQSKTLITTWQTLLLTGLEEQIPTLLCRRLRLRLWCHRPRLRLWSHRPRLRHRQWCVHPNGWCLSATESLAISLSRARQLVARSDLTRRALCLAGVQARPEEDLQTIQPLLRLWGRQATETLASVPDAKRVTGCSNQVRTTLWLRGILFKVLLKVLLAIVLPDVWCWLQATDVLAICHARATPVSRCSFQARWTLCLTP